jgi:hypothetical protein
VYAIDGVVPVIDPERCRSAPSEVNRRHVDGGAALPLHLQKSNKSRALAKPAWHSAAIATSS